MSKTTGLLICLLVFTLQATAQSFSENEIVGTWTVKQFNVLTQLPDDQKKLIDMVKEAFLRSKFTFNEDKTFIFDFELDKMKIENGHWKYNNLTKSYIIQDWKDKDTNNWILMEIGVKKEGNKIIFQLKEAFIELVMNKEY